MTQPPEYRRYSGSSYSSGPSGPRRRLPRDREARRRELRRRRLTALTLALLVLVLIIVAVVVATGGSGKTAGTGKSTPTPTPSGTRSRSPKAKPSSSPTALAVPTKEHPLKLFAGGDSMGGEMAAGMVPIIVKSGVVDPTAFYKVSSGLSRPDFYNWIDYWKKYAYRYKAIVFMLGTNDGQNMVGSGGKIYQFPTDAWRAEYKRRAGEVMDIMIRSGVQRVYWVSMPIMASANFSSYMRAINAGFRDAAKTRKQVMYVDIWGLFATSSGTYDSRWRQSDGVHFNIAGMNRLSQYVTNVVEKDWKISPTPPPSTTTSPSTSSSAKSTPSP